MVCVEVVCPTIALSVCLSVCLSLVSNFLHNITPLRGPKPIGNDFSASLKEWHTNMQSSRGASHIGFRTQRVAMIASKQLNHGMAVS